MIERNQTLELALSVAKTAAEQAIVYHMKVEENRLIAWKSTPAAKRGKYIPELDRAHLNDTMTDLFDGMTTLIRQEMAK